MIGAVVVGLSLLLVLVVPSGSASVALQVTPGSEASGNLVIPHASWVTVHFSHPGSMGMRYWMDGPSGMMFDGSMMHGGYDYSFWSWGGTYHCGAAYSGTGDGASPAWANATWGYS